MRTRIELLLERRIAERAAPNVTVSAGKGIVPVGVDFASGLSRPAHLEIFAGIGEPSGIVATESSDRVLDMAAEYARSGVRIMVDSGAFTAKLSDFTSVFRAYRRVATGAEPSVTVVAPDVVGDQPATMAVLRRWQREIQDLVAAGVEVLVPLQTGPMELSSFWSECVALLGSEVVPALPGKKAATLQWDAIRFAQESGCQRIHLLGIGWLRLREWASMLPVETVDGDSSKLRSMVGGPNRRTRVDSEMRELMRSGESQEKAQRVAVRREVMRRRDVLARKLEQRTFFGVDIDENDDLEGLHV